MGIVERKKSEKARRWDAVVAMDNVVRGDDKAGDEHRRMAAHAHVMTHHALELDTPEAHEAAAQAHDKVAEMHRDVVEEYPDDEEAPESSERAPAKRK